jgi:glutamate dehydrogenase
MATTDETARDQWSDAPADQQRWLRHYYAGASPDALALIDRSRLIDAARAHRELARTPPPAQGRIELSEHGDGPGHQLLSVCPDRPFLVDTLHLTLRRHGAQVLATFHPQLGLLRDGALPEVTDHASVESLIQVQLNWPGADAARRQALQVALESALVDLQQVVDDFAAMTTAARDAARACRALTGDQEDEAREVADLMDWLVDGHFTFLAVQPTVRDDTGFRMAPEQGLGLAAAGRCLENTDRLIAARSELDRYAESTRLVVVTQSTERARVHHDEPLDVISVKRLGNNGEIVGTLRLIGLFTTDVYIERPRHIPLLRQRVAAVIRRAGHAEGSHSGRSLRDTLAMLPRSELWQSSEDELFALGTGVMDLRDRHQLRLFLRRDRYGRFFSALMYLPRDRYDRSVRDRLVAALKARLAAADVDRSVEFPRGGRHACIRVRLTTPGAPEMPDDLPALERELLGLLQTWGERLVAAAGSDASRVARARRYAAALPAAYQDQTPPGEALDDIAVLASLNEARRMRMRLPVSEAAGDDVCFTELKLFSRSQPAALSAVMPQLEHFGLFVTGQTPTAVAATDDQPPCWIHRFDVRPHGGCAGTPADQQRRMEAAFAALLAGEIEDDPLNALVLRAGLTARETVVIRAVVRYLVQTGLPYSQSFIEQQLVAHPEVATGMLQVFMARHTPEQADDTREAAERAARDTLDAALAAVPGLDADRILRAAISVVDATLRTNIGLNKPVLSLKLDPAQVLGLPKPLPQFEIFVYSPDMEGVHLRGGRVARGGLRWSDRPQDFRTEVLGLVKAQQVKNSIIVPVGAKGGFVVKRSNRSDRDAWAAAGRRAYVSFLEGLLDLTDNRDGEQIVPPPGVVCRDAPDPYLVVAADKGTAQFSDLANETAARYDFWLGDAFASGGSQGYDHKKMGITARGAWESVKRHFRELGHDIQTTPFTVVGVGDMSGDVFGNGMLLSEQIRLIAAFDHRHIFIDPDPDPARSFAERQRLFALQRSSWDDYDRAALSEGGGIYPRGGKRIEISDAACAALGLASPQREWTPQALMNAILKAPVDLFWNGGIGTYVKARTESHTDVGDRANDALRVNGQELGARVVGEGGNLGLTQAGRVEFALAGGRIFTDAIDNAGGVHSSDREVNIKVPLNRLMKAGVLDRAQRDPLLVEMTEALAAAVIDDNLIQSGALSLAVAEQAERQDEYLNLMFGLEQAGRLDRVVDGLPDDETLQTRRRAGQGLTAPELAVLLAYTKIALFDDLIDSAVPDDPAFTPLLLAYFPEQLVVRCGEALQAHQLRREIIATILANAICNRMGMPFAHRLAVEMGAGRAAVVHAWMTAVQVVDADRYWQQLDQPKVGAFDRDRDLHQRTVGLLKHLTRDLLGHFREGAATVIADLEVPLTDMRTRLDCDRFSASLPARYAAAHAEAVDQYRRHGHPQDEAEWLGRTRYLGVIADLVVLTGGDRQRAEAVADRYFAVGDHFDLPGLHAAVNALKVSGQWPALGRAELRDELFDAQRQLAASVLAAGDLAGWKTRHAAAVAHAEERLAAVAHGEGDAFIRLTVAARALARLAVATSS